MPLFPPLISSLSTADIADSVDKRYCTDVQKIVIENTSGINTGNETAASLKTALGYKPTLVLSSQYSDSVILSGSTTTNEQTFSMTYTIPANYIVDGTVLRVTCGIKSVATATVPTSTYRLKLGTTTMMGCTAVALTAGTYYTGFQFLIRGTAAAGDSVNVDVENVHHYVSTAATSRWGAGGLIAVKTNGTLALGLSIQFSTNAVTNNSSLRQLIVEDLTM
jgi:hypothetical protein